MTLTAIPAKGGSILDTDIEKTLGSVRGTLVITSLTPSIGTGLSVNVAAGTAVIEGHYVNDSAGSAVTVSASITSSIWLQMTRDINGFVTGAQYVVAATQPADSAYICDFTSGVSTISSVTDKRAYNPASIPFGPIFTLTIDSAAQLSISVSGTEQLYVDSSGNFVPKQGINSAIAQTTLTGTSAGSAVWSQPYEGSSYKKFVAYLNGYENTTATSQTITFPVAFAQAPTVVVFDAGSVGAPTFAATATTTTLTLPNSMGATVTGWLICEGY